MTKLFYFLHRLVSAVLLTLLFLAIKSSDSNIVVVHQFPPIDDWVAVSQRVDREVASREIDPDLTHYRHREAD